MSIHKIQQFTFLYGTIHLGRQQSRGGGGCQLPTVADIRRGGIKGFQTSKIHDYSWSQKSSEKNKK